MKVKITPGTIGSAGLAIDLFGTDRVITGSWMEPVYAGEITKEEYLAAKELLCEYDVKIEPVKDFGQ